MVGKGAYSTEFHTELRWSDRAYIVCTKGVSYGAYTGGVFRGADSGKRSVQYGVSYGA